MSKIEVPQELQQQIIDLYVDKQMNRKQIKKELNLPFGDSVIKRILVENNIEVRSNPGAQKGGRKKQEVDKELEKRIIELYEQGYGLDKIVKLLNLPFSFDKVRSILIDNGIHIRNVKESANPDLKHMPDLRKYKINDDYVFESHNGAWLLGFIAADGYLPNTRGAKNRVAITVARKDEKLLHLIKNELDYEGQIYQFMAGEDSKYEASSIAFTSKKIRQKIESYGIVNNKTFKLNKLPDLPEEYIIDFIAGFFDGDGSVYEKEGTRINMSITCASYDFLDEIRTFLHEKYGVTKVNIYSAVRKNEIYDIKYGKADSLILGEKFYNNNYLRLPRKKNKYFELRGKYES